MSLPKRIPLLSTSPAPKPGRSPLPTGMGYGVLSMLSKEDPPSSRPPRPQSRGGHLPLRGGEPGGAMVTFQEDPPSSRSPRLQSRGDHPSLLR